MRAPLLLFFASSLAFQNADGPIPATTICTDPAVGSLRIRDDDSPSSSNSSSAGPATYSSTNSSSTSSSLKSSFSTSINQQLPAGSVVMVTPATTASTYVKVGQSATFSWTFTNLLVTPDAYNVELQCSSNLRTYTLATSVPISQQSFVWNSSDTDQDSQGQIPNAMYTLIIYDSGSSASAAGSAGYLAPFNYIFGVYRPQSYTNWAGDELYINEASTLKISFISLVCCLSFILLL